VPDVEAAKRLGIDMLQDRDLRRKCMCGRAPCVLGFEGLGVYGVIMHRTKRQTQHLLALNHTMLRGLL